MNEQDVIVPAIEVPYSPAKSAKKSARDTAAVWGALALTGLTAVLNDPAFAAAIGDLIGDNKRYMLLFTLLYSGWKVWSDRRKHQDGGNLVEVKGGY